MSVFEKFKMLFVRHESVNTLKHKKSLEELWKQDPLSHPDLKAMSEHELADLPFERWTIDPE